MGLLSKIMGRGRRPGVADEPFATNGKLRACQVEKLEGRCLMAGDIHVGMTYLDPNDGDDVTGNTMQVTWNGGAPGTQLTQLVIDTDKNGDGLSLGDTFFHTGAGGPGVFGSMPFTIVDQGGVGGVTAQVANGGTQLILNFTGFDAGEKLVFKIDVDEMGFLKANAVAEGAEFEGSKLTPTFNAPHYYAASDTDIFVDDYDSKLAGLGLNLPPDSYVPPASSPTPIYTAGAALTLAQTPLPIKISGTVFDDKNANNQQESGDQGIAGVTLELLKFDNGVYTSTGLTTTTDANGHYQFLQSVLPGRYRIVETQPGSYLSVGAKAGTISGAPAGVVTSVDVISDIDVLGGDESIENDFAEARPATLSGHVYHDANNNGLLDGGELGIGGTTIQVQYLPASGPAPAAITVTTAADGSWSVTGLLPGAYKVTEVQPAGWLDGKDHAGSAGGTALTGIGDDQVSGIALVSGQIGADYDFGELAPASIAGIVFADRDGNTSPNPADPRLADVTVKLLDGNGQQIATIKTDSQGRYKFENLRPGVYRVQEVQPDDYFQGGEKVGSVGGTPSENEIAGITLTSGTSALDYDFYELEPVSIGGTVYVDANDNGVFDSGEATIAGVVIKLLDAAGNPTGQTATTAADGTYRFEGLRPGTYGVAEEQPQGYFDGQDAAGTAGGTAQNPGDKITGAVLTSAMSATGYDFGELPAASIGGQVHGDLNGDCTWQPGEPLLQGVTIWLLDASGTRLRSVTTDANGEYVFTDLEPNKVYGIEEVQPAGYFSNTAKPGTAGGVKQGPDKIVDVLLHAGEVATHYDFCEALPASIEGTIHADRNGDCEWQPGEPLVVGATVWLLDENGQRITSTTTDQNGHYAFVGLKPGTYGVEEVLPQGYYVRSAHPGDQGGQKVGGDKIIDAVLGSGVAGKEYDFCVDQPATISGFVYADLNQNCNFDTGESGIAGVTVRLLDAGGNVVQTTITAGDGSYSFVGLMPGEYGIAEEQPEGYYNGCAEPGDQGGVGNNQLDQITQIELGTAVDGHNYNFGELPKAPVSEPPPPPPPANPILGFVPAPVLSPAPIVTPLGIGPAYSPPAPGLLPTAPPITENKTYFGGVGTIDSYTWHLSVVNGGAPRGEPNTMGPLVRRVSSRPGDHAWTDTPMNEAQWNMTAAGKVTRQVVFGRRHAKPVTGDFNGDGVTDVGVFIDGEWFIDLNGNGAWDEGDLWAELGTADDMPVTGDWDGDGKTDIGIFGPKWPGDERAIAAEPGLPDPDNRVRDVPKNLPPKPHEATTGVRTMRKSAAGQIRSDVIDHVFRHGVAGDVPLAGDFNGDGVHTIALFSAGMWYLDNDGDGKFTAADTKFAYGLPSDLPVAGDFDGDGVSEIGVYRDGVWYIDRDHNRRLDARDKAFELGGPDDLPVVGDWDGDGAAEPGTYQPLEQAATPEEPLAPAA